MNGKHRTIEDAPPPCECCKYSTACTYPDGCIPFREYVNTGKAIGPRKLFEDKKRADYHRTLEILKASDVDCIEISTSASVSDALIKYFRYREKMKR